jgi:hypothetical protein
LKKILLTWWFDTEDFVTPQSDDAPKWIAEFFRKNKYKATFKIVAEKVRALEKRRRFDVIKSIAAHDVGFHTDKHSAHPTIYEYMKNKTWENGCKEFERREHAGFQLIQDTFGHVVCFGHPGPAWAAEAYPSLPKWNIPAYLDASSILRLNDMPYWYCNTLNLQVGGPNFFHVDEGLVDSRSLRTMKHRYRRTCARLRRKGPGMTSLVVHPHTLVTMKYWDLLNFTHGHNRRQSEYRLPPLRDPVEIGMRFRRLQEFVRYTASQPNTRMINATDATTIYRDKAKIRVFKRRDLLQIISQIRDRISYVEGDRFFVAPSEILWLTASALAEYSKRHRIPHNLRIVPILGPSKRVLTQGSLELPVARLVKASVGIREQLQRERKIPDMVKIGTTILSPGDYLAASAHVLRMILTSRTLPEFMRVRKVKFDCERHIDKKAFNRAFRWYALPPGFRSPGLIEHALLQTWTLKPAFPSGT